MTLSGGSERPLSGGQPRLQLEAVAMGRADSQLAFGRSAPEKASTPQVPAIPLRARSSLFKQLNETPGRETLEALKRMRDDPDLQFPAERLIELAYGRASADAEHDPWPTFEA